MISSPAISKTLRQIISKVLSFLVNFLVDQKHFQNYLKKMNSYEQVHLRKTPIAVGDKVVVKMDFDNNTATRKKAFQTFYEEKIYTVVEVLKSSHLRVSCENEEKIVFKGRVKKVK
jgi:translation initiation factor IF-1